MRPQHSRSSARHAEGRAQPGDLGTEARLAHLAASSGPLRRAFAAVAARLLEARAYERLCYARLGDYARERVGLSARQLHDLAQVHRALKALPRLERALLANELPWSKVRLLARVASPADEGTWIARARSIPIRQLEREMRASAPHGRRDEPNEQDLALPLTRVTIHCTPAVREKWTLAHEMADRVAGQRLRADEALEWVTAEACSAPSIDPAPTDIPDDPAASARSDSSHDAGDEEPGFAASARLLPPHPPPRIEPLLAALDEADAFELDRRLRLVVHHEQTLDAAIAPLLRVVTSAEHEWSECYQTLETYAAEQLGMSASKARALLRIERAGDVCPELRDAFRDGRLSWAKAQCLVPLLRLDLPGEWRPRWVAWAERVTVRRLEADVGRALLLRAGHDLAWQRDVAWLFVAVRESFRAKLRARGNRPPSDGEAFAALLDHALSTWTLRETGSPRPNPVIERDGYRCAVPGCSSRRNLHDHHVVFRSAGGSDAPQNRITLFAFHHHRCLHAGRLRVNGRAPERLVFELGVRAGAPPLARYRSGDIAARLRELDPAACQRGLRTAPAPLTRPPLTLLDDPAGRSDEGRLRFASS